MASRNLDDLIPSLKEKAILHQQKCKEAGIDIFFTCTARLVKEQIALYVQGRQSLNEVNELRRIAKMPLITERENRRKVTWTLNSKHLIDLDDTRTDNDKSRAYDIAIKRGNEVIWDIKVSLNKNAIPDYEEVARIGESLGIKAGARFKNPDYPHFEI